MRIILLFLIFLFLLPIGLADVDSRITLRNDNLKNRVELTDRIFMEISEIDSGTIDKNRRPSEKEDEIKYVDYIEDADVVYTKEKNRVKEEIILKKKPKYDEIVFKIELQGYEWEIGNDGHLYIWDDKEIGRFVQPFVVGSGETLPYTFDGENYSITGIQSLDYRSLPVIIDPTYEEIEANIIAYFPFTQYNYPISSIGNGAGDSMSAYAMNTNSSSLVPGKIGNAIFLDGISQVINITNQSQTLNFRSLCFWLKSDEVSSASKYVYHSHLSSGDVNHNLLSSDGQVEQKNSFTTVGVNSPFEETLNNQWHFICWETPNSPNALQSKLYIDGKLNTTSGTGGTTDLYNPSGFSGSPHMAITFGGDRSSGFFNGTFDEIFLYDGQIGASYVSWLYNNGKGRGLFNTKIDDLNSSITNEDGGEQVTITQDLMGWCNASFNTTSTIVSYNFSWYNNSNLLSSGYVDGKQSFKKTNVGNLSNSFIAGDIITLSCYANSTGITSDFVNSTTTIYNNTLTINVTYQGGPISGLNTYVNETGGTFTTNPFSLLKDDFDALSYIKMTFSGAYPSSTQQYFMDYSQDSAEIELSLYGIDNCINMFNVTTNATALNVSFFKGSSLISTDYAATFYYGLSAGVYTFNFSTSGNQNNFKICTYPNSITLYTDAIIEYNGTQTYHLYQTSLSNITKQIELHTQEASTEVTFSVIDFDTDDVQDAYIHILQWDPGTNTYSTTEILKTDVNGQAVGNIVLGTQYYRFIVLYNGVVKLIDPELQGIKIYTTTRTFRINLDDQAWYNNYDEVTGSVTSLSFNESGTNSFVFSWSNPTGTSLKGCLAVNKRNQTGSVNLFTSCSTSASSSIVYALSPTECNTYFGVAYFDFTGDIYHISGSPLEIGLKCDYSFKDVKGEAGNKELVFFSWMAIAALAFMGIALPELSFILASIGLIGVIVMGLLDMIWSLAFGWIIVGIILMWKYNRK